MNEPWTLTYYALRRWIEFLSAALPPPFDPTALPGLFEWQKADEGVYQDAAMTTPALADGDPVGGWADLSGQSNAITQAILGVRPQLKLGIQHGLPVVRCDGIATYLSGAVALAGLTAASQYLVVSQRTADQIVFSLGSTAAPTSLNYTGTLYDSFGSTVQYSAPSAPAPGPFHVFGSFTAPGSFSDAVDGVTFISSPTNSVGWTSTLLYGASPGHPGAVDFGELIVYDRILSNLEDAAIRAYLKARWATP